MNDPHVEWLEYRFQPKHADEFRGPLPPSVVDQPQFDASLADHVLRCSMKTHVPTLAEAREIIEPFLRAWELDSRISQGIEFSFAYANAQVIDRKPPPPGSPIMLSGNLTLPGLTLTTKISRTHTRYPEPPNGFMVSDSVQRMWRRFEDYRANPNLLTHMGNFCLTEIERVFGGKNNKRRSAATALDVEYQVLSSIGFLCGEVGDLDSTARKAHVEHPRPHTQTEREWLEAAIRRLIYRVGEKAAHSSQQHATITMADLPKL